MILCPFSPSFLQHDENRTHLGLGYHTTFLIIRLDLDLQSNFVRENCDLDFNINDWSNLVRINLLFHWLIHQWGGDVAFVIHQKERQLVST